MSAFYVGQKVRKVRGLDCIGSTAIVAGFDVVEADPSFDMVVRLLENGVRRSGRIAYAGLKADTRSTDWEPVIPDDLESLAEINALYEPSPETVRP